MEPTRFEKKEIIGLSTGQMSTGTNHLWHQNHPEQFWQVVGLDGDLLPWAEAIQKAISYTQIPGDWATLDEFLACTLGEARFGKDHWDLSNLNRFYWWLKPIIPAWMIYNVRSVVNRTKRYMNQTGWPIEDRYIRFLWQTLVEAMKISGHSNLRIKDFWPSGKKIGFVLTHDVETPEGQKLIPKIADLEESLGYHSSFNIVGNQIPSDPQMLREINSRGFEIGLHGWRHDATPFSSQKNYLSLVEKMNLAIKQNDLQGHRSPLNLRQPQWMQALEIDYDLSFFDTDPFEPVPGGSMSIWPFYLGRFVELPATLVQDNTLFNLLGEKTIKVWLEKMDFIQSHRGMALVNTHPDYLIEEELWNHYQGFLSEVAAGGDYWNGLPRDVAKWWRKRSESEYLPGDATLQVDLVNEDLVISRGR